MPDAAPAPVAPAPAASTAPAAAAPPAVKSTPETVLEAIKARVKQSEKPPEGDKPADDKPPNVVPDAGKVLSELSKLQRTHREQAVKLKEAEEWKTDAEFTRDVKKLWSGTADEKLQVLAKLSGNDPTDELAALVALFYERDGEGADGKSNAPSGELKALTELVTSLKTELSEWKNGDKVKAEAQTAESQARQLEASKSYFKAGIEAAKDKYVICARPENIEEASSLADSAAIVIGQRKDEHGKPMFDLSNLTPEVAQRIRDMALEEVEKEYEQLGQRFSKTPAQPANFLDKPAYNKPLSRPTLQFKKLDNKKASFTEVLQHYRDKYAQAGGK